MNKIDHQIKLNVIKDYIENKLSLNEAAIKNDIAVSTVSNIIEEFGYNTRSIREGMELNKEFYKIHKTYFEKIDDYDKSQILGFIGADGYLYDKNYSSYITIALNNKDLNYLTWIKNKLKTNIPIKNGKTTLSNGKTYTNIRFNICNIKICSDLKKLGIHQRKSLTYNFPTLEQVSEEFIPAYVLGYFEGDGCIHWKRNKQGKLYGMVGICCTKEWGEKLGEYLTRLNIKWKLRRKKEHIERNINTWSLKIETPQNCCRFFDWIYNSYPSNKIMLRKYNKFKELRDLYDLNYNFIQTEEWLKQRSERLAEAGTGRKFSEESREKMRKSAQAREEKKRLENPKPAKIIKHRLSDEVKKEMVDYYINNKVSLVITGEKYGISAKSVQRIIQKMGLYTRSIKEAKTK